jgi:hypothetical protein
VAARTTGREGLPQPVDRIACLPFLSKVGQSLRVGDRTSIDGSMVTVAGLCRNRTGFAAAQRVVE